MSAEESALRPVRRVTAHAVVSDDAGRVLLVAPTPQCWSVPGVRVRQGEDPRDAVARAVSEQAGAAALAAVPREVDADLTELVGQGLSVHTLRLVFDVSVPDVSVPGLAPGVAARSGLGAGSGSGLDRSRAPDVPVGFVTREQAAGRALTPLAAGLLGVPGLGVPGPAGFRGPGGSHNPAGPGGPVVSGGPGVSRPPGVWVSGGPGRAWPPGTDPALSDPDPAQSTDRVRPGPIPLTRDVPRPGERAVPVQRPAVYAVLLDVRSEDVGGVRVLLTGVSHLPGVWMLPGGGIDHGERPLPALVREVYEETGLPYTVGPLLDISSRYFTGRAPDGRLEDFHGVRAVFGGWVPTDLPPRVVEVGGSTDAVAWVPLAELARLSVGPVVTDGVRLALAARGWAS